MGRASLDFAFDCGATAATLIPTRGGNGAMDDLARRWRLFATRIYRTLEAAVEYGLVHETRSRFRRSLGHQRMPACAALLSKSGSRDCAE